MREEERLIVQLTTLNEEFNALHTQLESSNIASLDILSQRRLKKRLETLEERINALKALLYPDIIA